MISDQELGDRCQNQCDSEFIDCTKECEQAPSERECLQECNRSLVACSNGMIFKSDMKFLIPWYEPYDMGHII